MKLYTYWCVTKSCVNYRKEIRSTLGPAEYRALVGRYLRCCVCREAVYLGRIEPAIESVSP